MKQLIPALLIFLVVVLGCNSGREQSQATPAKSDPPVAVKADDLIKTYKANEIAADEKYRGKLLEVSGRLTDIAETLGSLQADLGVSSSKDTEFVTVKCVFAEAERPKLSKLQKGTNVTFLGTGDGMTAGLYVGLTDCTVK
jgi:hypothetical protein